MERYFARMVASVDVILRGLAVDFSPQKYFLAQACFGFGVGVKSVVKINFRAYPLPLFSRKSNRHAGRSDEGKIELLFLTCYGQNLER
jgi:hypothetical protein